MKSFSLTIVLLVCLALTGTSLGSRILIAGPQGTKSHQNAYLPIAKEFAQRGHDVTIITNYISDDLAKFSNVNQIWMEKLVFDLSTLMPNPFTARDSWTKQLETIYEMIKLTFTMPTMVAETIYSDPRILELMNKEKFDLVMISEACGVTCTPFGWQFKAPVIALSPNVLFPGRASTMGDDENYSYVPFILSPFSDKMSLMERTKNFLISKVFYYVYHDFHLNTMESLFKKFVDPNAPPFVEMEKNFSLIFTNSHPSFTYPRSLPPQVIEVGGLHCRPAKPLPQDLEKFVSSSKDGFILFAVGSALKMDDMPEETVQAFIKVFASLPQHVIWQWKGKVRSDLPKNVLAIPWLPQQDLLGHPKCRAFLTHGGLNSLQEAIYHAIPVLGLPFGTDQILNVGRAVKEGYALTLNWKDVRRDNLAEALQDLLYNATYKRSVEKLSNLFHDQIQTPLERAVFWTEFALRHKGADHLRLGSINLVSYQRALFDVYTVLFLGFIIPLFLTFLCLRKCCCSRKVSQEKKRQ